MFVCSRYSEIFIYIIFQLLDGLNTLRQEGTFCDVTIVVDGREFQVHKAVLSAASPYFKAMFTCNLAESTLAKVPLNGLEPSIIEQLLDYIYSSEVVISKVIFEYIYYIHYTHGVMSHVMHKIAKIKQAKYDIHFSKNF